jgi:hypothetical protein
MSEADSAASRSVSVRLDEQELPVRAQLVFGVLLLMDLAIAVWFFSYRDMFGVILGSLFALIPGPMILHLGVTGQLTPPAGWPRSFGRGVLEAVTYVSLTVLVAIAAVVMFVATCFPLGYAAVVTTSTPVGVPVACVLGMLAMGFGTTLIIKCLRAKGTPDSNQYR